MPKFSVSYAHDVSCYFDFVVEAETEEEAEKKAEQAMKDGVFEQVTMDPCWETGFDNERVFVLDAQGNDLEPTLEELIEDANKLKKESNEQP